MISWGVSFSLPAQNGHGPDDGYGSCFWGTGRLARSVGMMTQRPTIGSLRNSGIVSPWIATATPFKFSSIGSCPDVARGILSTPAAVGDKRGRDLAKHPERLPHARAAAARPVRRPADAGG